VLAEAGAGAGEPFEQVIHGIDRSRRSGGCVHERIAQRAAVPDPFGGGLQHSLMSAASHPRIVPSLPPLATSQPSSLMASGRRA
jgi:hypothetical protein